MSLWPADKDKEIPCILEKVSYPWLVSQKYRRISAVIYYTMEARGLNYWQVLRKKSRSFYMCVSGA